MKSADARPVARGQPVCEIPALHAPPMQLRTACASGRRHHMRRGWCVPVHDSACVRRPPAASGGAVKQGRRIDHPGASEQRIPVRRSVSLKLALVREMATVWVERPRF